MDKLKKIHSYIGDKWFSVVDVFYRDVKIFEIVLTVAAIAVAYFLFTETQKQVKTAMDANELARINYIEENRPYVFPGTPYMDTTRHKNPLVHVPIINYGNTPAYNVNICLCFRCGDTLTDPRHFVYDSNWTWMMLAPHSVDTMIFREDEDYWVKDWNKKKATPRPYISGAIWYKDSWTNTLHHFTFVYKWIYAYGDRFTRQYQYESMEGDEKNNIKH